MKGTLIISVICIQVMGLFILGDAVAREFKVRQLTDKLFSIENTDAGETQVVIETEKGLVVLNSFWSEITAQAFKSEIIKGMKREDFLCLINMVDRLDLFGGNAAYKDVTIIGHRAFWNKYRGQEDKISTEIRDLIEMWREKEAVARERLAGHAPGSPEAIGEQQWINTCKTRAEELESGFSLVLPTETFEDRKNINAGDLTLNLIWFGRAGYDGMTVIVIPELKLAIIPGFVLHSHHLAPYPQSEYSKLDVPRWIGILEEILEGNNAVEKVLCGSNLNEIWTRERAQSHLHYIRELWKAVTKAEAEGKSLEELYLKLSLENDFAFVKEMQVYKDNGDDWIRPQNQTHIRLFYLQHKNPASEIIKNMGFDSVTVAVNKIRKLLADGSDIYVEEASINATGYYLLSLERYADALEAFRLNVEVYPQSANVFDSYAEALMKSGDTGNAVINYNKSLELNPENNNAREILKLLEK